MEQVVTDAMAQIPRSEVPDMPDRVIAATSLHLGLPLISKDRRIRGKFHMRSKVDDSFNTKGQRDKGSKKSYRLDLFCFL